jgi:hypothetical protein
VVRLARRRLWWRALPRRPEPPGRRVVERLHRLAGLPPEAIASIVDIPAATVVEYLADAGPVSWASVRQPVVARVRDRAAQKTSRRRMLTMAAVAAVVVSVAVPLLRVEEPAAATPPPATTPTRIPTIEASPTTFVYDVKLLDDRRGYALRANCDAPDCVLDLMSTDDGEHWTVNRLPGDKSADGEVGALVVLGPEEVVVDRSPVSDPRQAWRLHSTDGGQTWRRVNLVPRRSVPEIPAGAMLEPTCTTRKAACHGATLSMVLPGSGESVLLPSAPRLTRAVPGQAPLDGDRWWMVGMDSRARQWAVAVSEDDGRTWRVSRLAPLRKGVDESWSLVANGDDVYATSTGPFGDGQYGLLAIHHSDDGGRTWERTSGRVPHSMAAPPVAAADGTLLVNTPFDGTLLSRDHGRTFTEVERRFEGTAFWSGNGYVTSPEQAGGPIMFSPDGLHWRDLRLHG